MINHLRNALRRRPVTPYRSKQMGLISCVLCSSVALFSQSAHQSLKNGDHAYDRDNYKVAEKEYRAAADLKHDNPTAFYNIGNALYQQGNWHDAAERFEQAAKFSTKPDEQANAYYNLGNAMLNQRKFKEAVGAFESSLRLHPGDPDSKRNLQMAKKILQQQQPQQQKPESDNKDQKQPQSTQNQQNQPSNPSQGQTPKTPSGTTQQPNQSQSGKLKKEDAQRILETAVGPEDQRNARKYRSARQTPKTKGSEKDW